MPRDSIGWVEAEGDYARLHSASGAHLVRIPLSTLENRWRDHGFQRVHRSYLVSLRLVTGLRTSSTARCWSGCAPTARRPRSSCRSAAARPAELRDRLVRGRRCAACDPAEASMTERGRNANGWCSRTAAARAMVRTRVEVQEQTQVGDALVRGLVRAQLGLALRLGAVVVCLVGAIPLLERAVPRARRGDRVRRAAELAGAGRRWCTRCCTASGWAVCAPGRAGRARLRRRRRRRAVTGSPLTAAALLAAALATVAIGAYGLRFSRTTSDFLVASRTVGSQLERRGDLR